MSLAKLGSSHVSSRIAWFDIRNGNWLKKWQIVGDSYSFAVGQFGSRRNHIARDVVATSPISRAIFSRRVDRALKGRAETRFVEKKEQMCLISFGGDWRTKK